jgi:hypothetical protein
VYHVPGRRPSATEDATLARAAEEEPMPEEIPRGEREEVVFKDATGRSHTCHYERCHGREVLVFEWMGREHRVDVDTQYASPSPLTVTAGYVVSRKYSTALAVIAAILLHSFFKWGRELGAEVPFEMEGRRYLGRFEEHGPNANHAAAHRGVTLYERA